MRKIIGRSDGFNVQKVLWFADELNLEFEYIPAGGSFGGLDTPSFLEINPNGRVPVLIDQGVAIWESHTILRYLAATYGAPQFWSANPLERSHVERWMDWLHTSLQPAFVEGVFWGFYRTPAPQRNLQTIQENVKRCSHYFRVLDKWLKEGHGHLNGPLKYVCGNHLSLADICIGTALYRYFELKIDHPDVPYVKAWYERLQERPSYRKNIMVPFDYMLGKTPALSRQPTLFSRSVVKKKTQISEEKSSQNNNESSKCILQLNYDTKDSYFNIKVSAAKVSALIAMSGFCHKNLVFDYIYQK